MSLCLLACWMVPSDGSFASCAEGISPGLTLIGLCLELVVLVRSAPFISLEIKVHLDSP